jgi:glutathione S-transferase
MIQIYGSPRSSAGRCYLLLEELGIPYETVPLDLSKKEHKSEAFLRLNPNGKVPCLVDGEFVLWESIAINHYLAEKYKPALLGTNPQEKGLVQQWNLWAMTEMQPPLVDILIQLVFTPEDKRDVNAIAKAKERLQPMLANLDRALAGKTYLVGEKLTVADFNAASVVNIAAAFQLPMDHLANLLAWFKRMKDRPSFKKFADMRSH